MLPVTRSVAIGAAAGLVLIAADSAIEGPIHSFLAPNYAAYQIPRLNQIGSSFHAHLAAGSLLVITGLLQFKGAKHPRLHRWSGRLYLLLAFAAASSGIRLLETPFGGDKEIIPVVVFGSLLMLITFAQVVLAIRGDFEGHIRLARLGMAIVLGPLTVRAVYIILWAGCHLPEEQAMVPALWMGWTLNILLAFSLNQQKAHHERRV